MKENQKQRLKTTLRFDIIDYQFVLKKFLKNYVKKKASFAAHQGSNGVKALESAGFTFCHKPVFVVVVLS